jgi:hypothetical protein
VELAASVQTTVSAVVVQAPVRMVKTKPAAMRRLTRPLVDDFMTF